MILLRGGVCLSRSGDVGSIRPRRYKQDINSLLPADIVPFRSLYPDDVSDPNDAGINRLRRVISNTKHNSPLASLNNTRNRRCQFGERKMGISQVEERTGITVSIDSRQVYSAHLVVEGSTKANDNG